MTGDYCMFHKYGFCKNGDKCSKVHLKEVCLKRECESRKCDKRHPKPCKLMTHNGFCKFDDKCSYSHRLPKMVEDQNIKIKALAKIIEDQNVRLEAFDRLIQCQEEEIDDLKEKLLENQRREIGQLQNQINLLKTKNAEKEELIKKMDKAVKELNGKHGIEEKEMDESTLQESVLSPNSTSTSVKSEIFVKNSLKHLEDMELDIKKSRKISIIREKYGSYCDKLEEELQNNELNSVIYSMALERLKDLLKISEEETSKDLCVKSIEKCRKLLQS